MSLPSDAPGRVILVAHGQPSSPARPEGALAALAGQVQQLLPKLSISSATLAAPGTFEATCDASGERAVIYPCFMSAGWFTGKVLPKRLGSRPFPILPPLGLEPALPGLVAGFLRSHMAQTGLVAEQTAILLAAHGSARGDKAAAATRAFAAALSTQIQLRALQPGYVEQAPFVADTARALSQPTLCLPFFAQTGDHVRQDITTALQETRFDGELLPVIGELPGIPALIAQALRDWFAQKYPCANTPGAAI